MAHQTSSTTSDTPGGRGLHPLAVAPALLTTFVAWWLITGQTAWETTLSWAPSLGVDIAIRVDGLAILMLTLIGGVGLAVYVYGSAYMAGDPGRNRLFVLLTGFLLAMVGAVTTDNLLVLFTFWELTSVTSFLLVGFKHKDAAARAAAQQALLITAGGGLVLLAGFVQLGLLAETYSIQGIIARAPALADDPSLPYALVCIFIGAFSKSAQWPFHFWLPSAMSAPTPVSAFLHSATMVKLGVYLLARLKPAFGNLMLWEATLVTIGAITALWSMLLVMRERDLKRLLAWSTVSALGTLVLLIGLPGPGAAEATAALLLAHALYKAPLFFVAGNVDHGAGTRDIHQLAGLVRPMPWTAAIALLAGFSMAGVPLSLGYVAKDLIAIAKTAGLAFEWAGYASMVASAVTVAVASVAAVRVFWRPGGEHLPGELREAPPAMLVPPLAVASLGMVLGSAPGLAAPLIYGAARTMMVPDQHTLVGLMGTGGSSWQTTALVMGLGLVIFASWDRLHVWMDMLRAFDRLGLAAFYERSLKRIPRVARYLVAFIQNGQLRSYLFTALAASVVALGWALLVSADAWSWPSVPAPALPAAGAAAVVVGACITVCRVKDPFVMLLVSGLTGVGAAALFLFAGAPDVAFTQFAVEVAFVVVVAAVVLRVRTLSLPRTATPPVLPRLLLGLALGALVTTSLLVAAALEPNDVLARYFGERSLVDAHGHNVVNVIIVDFRALDTMGEISVVAVTFLAVIPLLQLLRRTRNRDEQGAA